MTLLRDLMPFILVSATPSTFKIVSKKLPTKRKDNKFCPSRSLQKKAGLKGIK